MKNLKNLVSRLQSLVLSIILAKRVKAIFIMLLLIQVVNIQQANAKTPNNYGRIYNVQDFIDDAPGTGAAQTTLGIQRCFTTVANRIYYDISNTESSYTIIFPKNVYTINGILGSFFVKPNVNGPGF